MENVRLFILIVTLGVLANASKIWWGIYTLILVSTNCSYTQLPVLNWGRG